MASVDYGSLVTATCANLVLYTLESAMACQFFARKRDGHASAWMKFRVWLALLVDTAATVAGCAFLYMYQSSHWGETGEDQPEDGDAQPETNEIQARFWKLIIGVLIAGTIASAFAQSFLLERFWKNIRHHLLGTAFAVSVLVLAVLVSVAAVIVCAYLQWTNAEVIVPFVWTAIICNLVASLGITLVSVCQRFAMRTIGPKPRFITRVFRSFIDTGIPSTIVAILALVAWSIHRTGAFVIALYYIQARIYSCTMLFTLRQPPPVRTDSWIQDMVATSQPQKAPPAPAPGAVTPITPDIFLRVEKSGRLSGIPEDGAGAPGQGWYNIDLGDAAARSSIEKDATGEAPPSAMVLHRNSTPFYSAVEEKR